MFVCASAHMFVRLENKRSQREKELYGRAGWVRHKQNKINNWNKHIKERTEKLKS
jgi:hypothetical protein